MSPKHLEKAVWTQEGMYRRHLRQINSGHWAEKSTLFVSHRPAPLHRGSVPHLHIRVALLFLVFLELSLSLHMSKITSFFKRPSGPPTFNTSASCDEDLEPPKNKSLKSGSNRDNSAYLKIVLQWQKNFTINLSYKVVEGPMNLWKKYGVKQVGNFRRTKHLQ